MPLNLDSCIAGVFTPGNIGASSGLPPVQPTVPALDGPAPSVTETAAAVDALDYFMGELLHEAANATDSYVATGGAYVLSVAEAAHAADAMYLAQTFVVVVGEVAPASDAPSVHIPGVVSASVTETAIAADTPDATVVAGVTYATWNAADKTANIALSNSDLTATSSGSTPWWLRAIKGVSSGKYYFEVTMTTWTSPNTGIGFAPSGATSLAGSTGTAGLNSGGTLAINAVGWAFLGPRASGDVIGIAIDIGANLLWMRVAPAGQWNASGTANPATGTGGSSISTLTKPLFPYYTPGNTGQAATANFGASAFAGTVPSGFTAGWPA